MAYSCDAFTRLARDKRETRDKIETRDRLERE